MKNRTAKLFGIVGLFSIIVFIGIGCSVQETDTVSNHPSSERSFPLKELSKTEIETAFGPTAVEKAEKLSAINSLRAWSYDINVLKSFSKFGEAIESSLTLSPKLGLMTIVVVASRNRCFY